MNILFTICGRAGSKGLTGKNLKFFNGYPLIAYTLSAIELFKSQTEHEVFIALNTDSQKLKESVSKMPNILLVDREKELTTDTVSKMKVICDTYFKAEKLINVKFDYVIDLDLTSPLRTVEDIKNLIKQKEINQDLDVIFSVVDARRNPYFNMVEIEGEHVKLVNKSNFTARQQAPSIYDMNASMYLYDPKFLMKNDYIFNGKCGIIKMKDYMVLDIDSQEDFEWMEYIYIKLLKEDQGIQQIYNYVKLNSSLY